MLCATTCSLSSLIPSALCPICCADILSPPYYFARRFINRSRNNLVSPLSIPRAILFIATARFLLGPAWAPRIVQPGPYFNINFPDGDTSFASTWPRISPKLIIIRVPFLLPPAVTRARKILLFPPVPLQGRIVTPFLILIIFSRLPINRITK